MKDEWDSQLTRLSSPDSRRFSVPVMAVAPVHGRTISGHKPWYNQFCIKRGRAVNVPATEPEKATVLTFERRDTACRGQNPP